MDVAIAGAGPAGSFLAWKFAERGLAVNVFEEHKEIGKPVACSGHVSRDIWDLIPYNDKIVLNEIKAARFHTAKKTYSVRKTTTEAFVLQRHELDKYVAGLAQKAGAQYTIGARVTDLRESKEDVSVIVKENGQERTLQTKLLAGCDGPMSLVRKKSGLKDPRFLHGIMFYNQEDDDSDTVDVWFNAPGLFAWRIPRGRDVEYGIATYVELIAKKYFDKFCAERGIRAEGIHSGLIPTGVLPRVSTNRIFLCGDAAAQVKPFTGGGIIYGMKAALAASETLNPEKPNAKAYEKLWRSRLANEIRLGWLMRNVYYTPLLDPLLSMLQRMNLEGAHMDRPSSLFKL